MALQEGWVLPARNDEGGFSSKVTGSGGFCRWGTTRGGAFPALDGGVSAGSRGWLCSVDCRVLFQQRGTTRTGFSNARWVLPAGDDDNGKNK